MGLIENATSSVQEITFDLFGGDRPSVLVSGDSFGTVNGIKKQSLPFVLGMIPESGPAWFFIFPKTTEQWEMARTTKTNVTYTQSGTHLDCNGILPPKINLQGTFGYYGTSKKDGGDAATMQYTLNEMIRSFYLQFSEYDEAGGPVASAAWEDRIKINGANITPIPKNKAPNTKLILYDFTTNKHWEVSVDNFKFTRNVQRRMLYMYSIQMTAIQEISVASTRSSKSVATKTPTIKTFLDVMARAKDMIGKAKKFLISVGQLAGATITAINDAGNIVKSAISIITDISDMVSGNVASAKTIALLPNSIAKQLISANNELLSAMLMVPNMPKEFIVEARNFMRAAYQLDAVTKNNGVVPKPITGVATTTINNEMSSEISSQKITARTMQDGFVKNDGQPENTLFLNGEISTPMVVTSYNITSNDNIYSIASRFNVDWKELVMVNNLEYPYITVDSDIPLPNTMMTGDRINIPGNNVTSEIKVGNNLEETLFGIDEELDAEGNMVEVNHGDIATVAGVQNLIMQLTHRFSTRRGELSELGHPEYGSNVPLFIGKINVPIWQEMIKLECKMIVLQDERVTRVSNETFYTVNTEIYYKADISLRNQINPITINVPLG